MENVLNRNTPPYLFAVTDKVVKEISLPKSSKPTDEILTVNSFLPKRGREEDTGFDVRVADPQGVKMSPGEWKMIPLGIRMFAPDGWWLQLNPRSGTVAKHHMHCLYGVIDQNYEGELCFVAQYMPDTNKMLSADHALVLPFGHRIAQVIPAPRFEMPVEGVSNEKIEEMYKARNASRGAGGFHSSGTK